MTEWRQAASDYLTVRRALGFKLRGHDRLLADFLDHLEQSATTEFTSIAALAWATGRPAASPTQWAHRLSVVRGFARHLHCIDPTVEVPPPDLLSRRRYRPAAHLYSQPDITALLEAVGALRPALRGATHQALFGLIAVTGMRLGEAIGLDRDHVDLATGVVHIPLTKFRKHRRLPLHESTRVALREYTKIRDALCPQPKAASFFVSTRGTRLLDATVHHVFRQLIIDIGLTPQAGTAGPKVHGLRHSFAVATVQDWHRVGTDPAGKLSLLSAYLGHANPAYTYWYLQACPELLGLAADRLERWEGQQR
jgi:integrase/recombinase XerD